MKIRLDTGTLNVDDHGVVMLFEDGSHGEVTLGCIEATGKFAPAFWLQGDAQLEVDIRQGLSTVYYGEKTATTRRTQAEWPEHVLQFLNLSGSALGRGLRKVSHDGRSMVREKGRYRDDDGQALHGVYLQEDKEWLEKLFIGHGRECLHYSQPALHKPFASALLNDDNLKGSIAGWTDEDGQPLARGRWIFERVLQGLMPLGEAYLLGRERVTAHYNKALEAGCEMLVYPHQRDAGKFRIIVHRRGLIAQAWDMQRMREAVDALLEAWRGMDRHAAQVQALQSGLHEALDVLQQASFARLAQELNQPAGTVEQRFLHSVAQGFPLEYGVQDLLTAAPAKK